jgi:hypothetical protein
MPKPLIPSRLCVFTTPFVLAALLDCCPVIASDPDPGDSYARSLKAADPPEINWSQLAGDYFYGDGFENNHTLKIHDNGTFTYHRDGCSGTLEALEGTIRRGRNRLSLTPLNTSKSSGKGLSRELMSVTWGERHYLIPTNDLLGFVNSINRGTEPTTHGSRGMYFLREGDWDRSADGLPGLPAEWLSRILPQPVTARIVGKNENGQWRISAGKSAYLYPKLEMFATPGADNGTASGFATLRIISVQRDHSFAIQTGTDKQMNLVDWTATTRIME